MEINRDNYEEYFLLYADNELTDYEKIEVLKFIRANKDLEDEFKMIQDTICKPDHVVMENKMNLLRVSESDFITEKNYEEIFVLYHDHELTEEEKNNTKLFVSQHPHLEKEFESIGIANLAPDNSIVFPGKKNLYKREKAGRVVPLIFWRSIAAAVFIGFGFWIFGIYNQQPTQKPGIVETVKPVKKAETISPKNIPGKKPIENVVENPGNQNTEVAEKEKLVEKKEIIKPNTEEEKEKRSYVQTATKVNNKKAELKEETTVEEVKPDVAVLENELKNIPQKKIIETNEISFQRGVEIKPIQKDIAGTQAINQAQSASYVADADQKNENYIFYNVTTEEFRKSKVGGFLKKVKRVVERNNPVTRLFSGDEKQVASN
ncbi:MAG: hypothetical protein ABI691_01780 [Ginsengibacter sp.]